MIEIVLLVLFLLTVVGVTYVGPVRDAIWVNRALRDDNLERMSKVNPESRLHTELALKAIQYDVAADNAWRQDFDNVVQAVKDRKSTALAIRQGASEPAFDHAALLDKARLTIIEDSYTRVERLVEEVQARAIEAPPEQREALEGIIHNFESYKRMTR